MSIRIQFFDGGYCTGSEAVVLTGGAFAHRRLPALFALLEHPSGVRILYDTGYTNRFHQITKSFPYRFYGMATPVHVREEDHAVNQLARAGVAPEDVDAILLSHFHADHIGGCKDFPHSLFICSKQGYEAVAQRKGFAAVRKAFLPQLLPTDFAERTRFIENLAPVSLVGTPLAKFNRGYDLFGDGSAVVVNLPGHAVGQLGLWLEETQYGPLFLVSDACWTKESYQQERLPSRIVNFLIEGRRIYQRTLKNLHHLHQNHPDLLLVPTHCEATLKELIAREDSHE